MTGAIQDEQNLTANKTVQGMIISLLEHYKTERKSGMYQRSTCIRNSNLD